MKVKIGNKIIDSNDQPVLIILDENEKDLIKNMDPRAFFFCTYPIGSKIAEIERFMKGRLEDRSNPFHLGVLNQEQFDDLTEWQRMDRRIKELEKQNKNLREAYADQKVKLDDYRETCRNHHNFMSNSETDNRAHWCWMWGEENHLESIACPILIPADWFRLLLQDARNQGKDAYLESICFLGSMPCESFSISNEKVVEDPNQLSMAIDNDVVIVNSIQVGD